MHCQSCGLPIAPTVQVCPRCGRPNVPASQPGLNGPQQGGSPSTEQFSWQPGNTIAPGPRPPSIQNGAYPQNPAHQQPQQWNTQRPGVPSTPFLSPSNSGQAPMPQQSLPIQPQLGATNAPTGQPQGGYQPIPHTTSGLAHPQAGGNQQVQQQRPSGQLMPPVQSGYFQGSGQPQQQGYIQTMAPAQSGPIRPQTLSGGPFSPSTTQSGPINPQAFVNQGAFPSAPLQTGPVQPPSAPLQSGPVFPQALNNGAFPPAPMQSGPIPPAAFQSGPFPPNAVQQGPAQPPTFQSGSFPPPEGSGSATFQVTPGQIQQRSPAGIVRSASVIQPIRTSPTRKILMGIGSGFIIALIVAVGYLALQKPSTTQVATTTQQIVQTHPKKLPSLPPITASDPQALYTQATSREAVSSDPLKAQSDNDWETVNSPGSCSFDNNTLHAVNSSTDGRVTMCIANATKYKNVAFQAQLTAIKGDTYGLIMHADSKGRLLYLFSATTTGTYTLAVTNGQNGSMVHVLAGGTSSAIKQGQNQSNQLTMIVRDNVLYLYANGKFLTKVSDTTATSGSVGLFMGNSQGDVSEARFTNAKMWSV